MRIYTTGKPFVVKSNIGAIEKKLSEHQFIHVHRSYIVAIHRITAYTFMDVEIGPIEIPIGQTYKEIIYILVSNIP